MTEPLLGVEQEIPAWSLQAAGTGAWSGPGAGRDIAGVSTREEAGASPLTLALTLGTSENAHLGERHHWRRIGHDDVVPESGDRRESLNRGDSASDPPAGFRVRRGSVSSVLWGGAGLWLLAGWRVRSAGATCAASDVAVRSDSRVAGVSGPLPGSRAGFGGSRGPVCPSVSLFCKGKVDTQPLAGRTQVRGQGAVPPAATGPGAARRRRDRPAHACPAAFGGQCGLHPDSSPPCHTAHPAVYTPGASRSLCFLLILK